MGRTYVLHKKHATSPSLERHLNIIQGPPGTGKTWTAAHIVKAWTEAYKNEYVLCSTDRNATADRLMSSLPKCGVHCVRLGSNVDYSDLVHKHMQQLKGYSRDYANWRKEQLEKATIGKWCVAVTTCIGSGHHILAK